MVLTAKLWIYPVCIYDNSHVPSMHPQAEILNTQWNPLKLSPFHHGWQGKESTKSHPCTAFAHFK